MDFKQARLDNLQNQISKLDCNHPKSSIVKRGPHYCRQCSVCGSIVGQWIPHDKVLNKDKVLPFDETIHPKYLATVRELRTELNNLKRDAEKTDFDAWYAQYLESVGWKRKRIAVLERCNHLCEGCRINRATIVHHTTYANVGNEFLFELVGLCQTCHESLHCVNTTESIEGDSDVF